MGSCGRVLWWPLETSPDIEEVVVDVGENVGLPA